MEKSLETAKSLFNQKKYQEAINICKNILEKDSNSIYALKLIGKAFLAENNIKDARFYLNKVLTNKPDDYEVIKDLGNSYQAVGDLNSAINHYQKALLINDNYAPALSNLGSILLISGNKKKGLDLLIKATDVDPQLAAAWINLAKGHLQFEQYVEAEITCQKAISINSNNFNYYFILGTILMKQERLVEAERTLRKTIELNPDFVAAYFNLAAVLNDLKHIQEAEIIIRKAIELNPNLFNTHFLFATILIQKNKYEEAEVPLRKTIELKPDFEYAYFELGTILMNLGKLKEAELSTRKAIELKPNFQEAYANLGQILKYLGKQKEAKKSLLKAIEIKPSWYLYYDYADSLFANKEFNSCIKNLEKASSLIEHGSSSIINAAMAMTKLAKAKSNNEDRLIDSKSSELLFDKKSDRLILNRKVEDELLSYLYTIKINKLNTTKDSRYGEGVCSDFQLFNNKSPIISKLSEDIKDICRKELGLKEIIICDSFFNIFISGCGQPAHYHINQQDRRFNLLTIKYSLVYYLDIGDQDGDMPGILKLHQPDEEILPTNGMIIIIGGQRFHSVSYRGNKNRVMIGVNFYGL